MTASPADEQRQAVDEFQSHRPLLFSIAYRMLGSASEAEDIVQEAYLRYHTAGGEIRSARSFLSTVVTRLALDHLKSARARREQYIGPWLPEPLLTGDSAQQAVERRESISLAFLVLLESLTPQERAVFVLHEVFEYSYAEIAAILGLGVANCRQLFHRARERVAERRPRFEPSLDAQRRLTERFLAACQGGDIQTLTEVLSADVTSWSDGGGKVSAARNPVRGRDTVIRLILGLLRKAPAELRLSIAEVNGGPALLLWEGRRLFYVAGFDIGGGVIHGLRAILNPDKLAFISRQLEGGSSASVL